MLGQLPQAVRGLGPSPAQPVEGQSLAHTWPRARGACSGLMAGPRNHPPVPTLDTAQSITGGLGKKCGPLRKGPWGISG